MYKIYSDDYLLYDDNIENLKVFSPKLTLELNKAGSFSFSIYTDHPYYPMIKKLKSIITVYQGGLLIFRGRAINIESGFYNQKKIDCEGELAFLIDSIQKPYEFSGSIREYLAMLLTSHNSQVDNAHKFTLGNVAVTDSNDYIVRSNIEHVTVWDEIKKKLLENLGGYLWVRHIDGVNYLDYLEDFNWMSSQKIEFSKNLMDLKQREKGEDIATVLIPLGAKLKDEEGQATDERLTIAAVNDGKEYIEDTEAISKYGRITKVQKWDDVTEPSNLLTKGKAFLAGLTNPDGTIELTAADLATVDTDFSSIHLGTYVPVLSKPHGIEQNLLVSKLVIELLNPVANKLTLGGIIESFTGKTAGILGGIQYIKDGKDGKDGQDGKDGIAGENFNWNLINGTKDFSGFNKYGDVSFKPDGDFTNAELPSQIDTGSYSHWILSEKSPIEIKEVLDKDFAFSFEFKRASGNGNKVNICIEFALCTDSSLGRVFYRLFYSKDEPISGEWQKKVVTGIANEEFFSSKQSGRTESFEDCTRLWVRIYHAGETPMLIRKCKFELGNTATTWSPSEKDIYGKNGVDGKTSYFHIKYSSVANPTTSSQMTETPSTYIGTYVDFVQADSTDPTKYTWSRFEGLQGRDGENGIPGKNGENGLTSYLHIAYANSADGKTGFDLSNSTNKLYIGQYTDFIKADSTDPTKYSWTKIKGENGKNGVDGKDGKDAAIQSAKPPSDTSYMWLDISVEPPLLKRYNTVTGAWEAINDTSSLNESIYQLEQHFDSSIKQTESKITAAVAEQYYLKGETDKIAADIRSEITQTANDVTIKFNKFNQDLAGLASGTDKKFGEVEKLIRFVDGRIELGIEKDPLTLEIKNDRISFKYNDAEVAYFSNNKLYVTDGNFTNSLQLGNFAYLPRNNGNLSFKKIS